LAAREGGEAIKANKIAASVGSVPRSQESGVRSQYVVVGVQSWSWRMEGRFFYNVFNAETQRRRVRRVL